MPRLVELSHVIGHGTVTYPGLPAPVVDDYLSFDDSHERYAPGTEFAIGRVTLVANTGTYLDTPAHRYRDGSDLAELPLDRCADLPAVVVDCPVPAVEADHLGGVAAEGAAVLLRTGWDAHWATERYGEPGHPYLTAAGARWLADRGAALVGIDSVNIDDTATGERPAHTTLLGAGIPVVEHLTGLAALPATGARFFAVPPLFRGLATFPVRAFAIVP
jgi:kynurenine formamidase